MFLRNHMAFKEVYDHYAGKRSKNEEDLGYFMTLDTFIQFMLDTRLLNGRLNILRFVRYYTDQVSEGLRLNFDGQYIHQLVSKIASSDDSMQLNIFQG